MRVDPAAVLGIITARPLSSAAIILACLAIMYVVFVAVRLGVHQRLPLALGPISLEAIPDYAARRYGERVLFTTDTPCTWQVSALRDRYCNPCAWSANRISETAGYLATMFRDRLGVHRGDRVAVLKTNHMDIHVITAGIVSAGGIVCPINGQFAADKLQFYLRNIGAEVLVSDVATLLRVLTEGGALGSIRRVVLAQRQPPANDSASARLIGLIAATHSRADIVWIESALVGVSRATYPVPRESS